MLVQHKHPLPISASELVSKPEQDVQWKGRLGTRSLLGGPIQGLKPAEGATTVFNPFPEPTGLWESIRECAGQCKDALDSAVEVQAQYVRAVHPAGFLLRRKDLQDGRDGRALSPVMLCACMHTLLTCCGHGKSLAVWHEAVVKNKRAVLANSLAARKGGRLYILCGSADEGYGMWELLIKAEGGGSAYFLDPMGKHTIEKEDLPLYKVLEELLAEAGGVDAWTIVGHTSCKTKCSKKEYTGHHLLGLLMAGEHTHALHEEVKLSDKEARDVTKCITAVMVGYAHAKMCQIKLREENRIINKRWKESEVAGQLEADPGLLEEWKPPEASICQYCREAVDGCPIVHHCSQCDMAVPVLHPDTRCIMFTPRSPLEQVYIQAVMWRSMLEHNEQWGQQMYTKVLPEYLDMKAFGFVDVVTEDANITRDNVREKLQLGMKPGDGTDVVPPSFLHYRNPQHLETLSPVFHEWWDSDDLEHVRGTLHVHTLTPQENGGGSLISVSTFYTYALSPKRLHYINTLMDETFRLMEGWFRHMIDDNQVRLPRLQHPPYWFDK